MKNGRMAKKKGSAFSNTINLKNKQAFYNYEILDKYQAGMVLEGTEIKSIRMGQVSFVDGYCFFVEGDLFVKGLHISPYKMASFKNHDPAREKKLLLKKIELSKLNKRVKEKGLSVVPLRVYINDRGLAKIEIALAKGKKVHDKRESIKERDLKRELKDL